MSWRLTAEVRDRQFSRAGFKGTLHKALMVFLAEWANDRGVAEYRRSKADFALVCEISERKVYQLFADLADPANWPNSPNPKFGLIELEEEGAGGGRGVTRSYRIVRENLLALPLNEPAEREEESLAEWGVRGRHRNPERRAGFPESGAVNPESDSENPESDSLNPESRAGFSPDSIDKIPLSLESPETRAREAEPVDNSASPRAEENQPAWQESSANRHWIASLGAIRAALGERHFGAFIDTVLPNRDDGAHLTLAAVTDFTREFWELKLVPLVAPAIGRQIAVVQHDWSRRALERMKAEGRLPSQIERAQRETAEKGATGDAA